MFSGRRIACALVIWIIEYSFNHENYFTDGDGIAVNFFDNFSLGDGFAFVQEPVYLVSRFPWLHSVPADKYQDNDCARQRPFSSSFIQFILYESSKSFNVIESGY